MELHPIEAEWRRFRSSERAEILRKCLGLISKYFREMGMSRFPPEIVLPASIPFSYLKADEVVHYGTPLNQPLTQGYEWLGNTVLVWAAYRESKIIYRVDPFLAECLSRSAWPDHVPTEALRLSGRCVILELPADPTPTYVAAVFDLATGAEASEILELRLSNYCLPLSSDSPELAPIHHQWLPVSVLRLDGPDLAACLARAQRTAEQNGASGKDTATWRNHIVALALTVLLYLAGEPDVVRQVHPGAKPTVKGAVRRRDPERFKDLQPPTINAVGTAFTRAIERWEIERQDQRGEATGRSVRPHMRRAHAHLYWTGVGRGVPRVRFLLPISVRAGKLVEEPEMPLLQRV
jgi:hypothetical protein